jgi:hypothetical protein
LVDERGVEQGDDEAEEELEAAAAGVDAGDCVGIGHGVVFLIVDFDRVVAEAGGLRDAVAARSLGGPAEAT